MIETKNVTAIVKPVLASGPAEKKTRVTKTSKFNFTGKGQTYIQKRDIVKAEIASHYADTYTIIDDTVSSVYTGTEKVNVVFKQKKNSAKVNTDTEALAILLVTEKEKYMIGEYKNIISMTRLFKRIDILAGKNQ